MTASDDSFDEMTTSSHSDNADADDLDPALRDLFATLRARSLDGPDVVPSPALAEFVGVDPADRTAAFDAVLPGATMPDATMPEPEPLATEVDPRQRRIPVLSAAAALFATLTGKLLLTGGLAAATIGGAHATGVVDVPGLPGGDDAGGDVVTEFDENAADDSSITAAPTTVPTTVPPTDATVPTTTVSPDAEPSSNDRSDVNSRHQLEVDLGDHRLRLDIEVSGSGLDDDAIDEALTACAAAVDRVDDAQRDLADEPWLDAVDDALAVCNELMAAVVGDRWNAIERIPDLDLDIPDLEIPEIPELDIPDVDIPDVPDLGDLDEEIDAIQQEIDDAIDDARDAADRAIDEANGLLDGVDDLLDGIGTDSGDLFD